MSIAIGKKMFCRTRYRILLPIGSRIYFTYMSGHANVISWETYLSRRKQKFTNLFNNKPRNYQDNFIAFEHDNGEVGYDQCDHILFEGETCERLGG